MKKHFILLISLLYSALVFTQEKKIKDAVYIIFKESKNQIKEAPYLINKHLEPDAVFKMIFDKEGKSYFAFYKAKYLDFDAVESNTIADVKIVDRSFLREHKEDIITMKEFLKMGIGKSYDKVVNTKKIYLIDKSEIKKGKVIMYEVGLHSTYFPEI